MKQKPHIKKLGLTWGIFRARWSSQLIGLASSFDRLGKVGPWRSAEMTCDYFGDSKKPI